MLKKAIEKVENVIKGIKFSVIESKGFMYHMDTVQKFDDYLKESQNEHVLKLSKEIEEAIQAILNGGQDEDSEPPKLEIQLDDE
jgi:hypothetical protein